mgnify:CR=1 FL=1|jgi:hypothetical protein
MRKPHSGGLAMSIKTKLFIGTGVILVALAGFLFFRYFFSYEQRNIFRRRVASVTGMNLTVTVFDYNGKIVKRWTGVQRITSGSDRQYYTYFFTREGKYVQIPTSVWYVAEEE